MGRPSYEILTPGSEKESHRQALQAVRKTGFWQGELELARRTGEVFPIWLTLSALRNGAGHITHIIAMFSDITERRLALRNGSALELLAQSQGSVRGTRVHEVHRPVTARRAATIAAGGGGQPGTCTSTSTKSSTEPATA